MSSAVHLMRMVGEKTSLTPQSATFVSYDDAGPVIDIGDGRVLAAFGSDYLPEVGEAVLVWIIDGVPYLMGPATPKPATGTVTTVASNRVTLSTAAGTVGPLPYVGSAPAVGQTMRILWHGGGIAFTATDSVAPSAPEAPPSAGVTTRVDEFQAIDTGTWNTGGGDTATSYFNSEVWASNTTIGFWFYGSKIKDTLPPGAVPKRLQIYVAARQIQGGPPVFTLHDNPAGPGDSLGGGTAVAVSNYQWVDLPAVWITDLRQGGSAYGVGTRHGGYNIFKSRAADGDTGRLRITSDY